MVPFARLACSDGTIAGHPTLSLLFHRTEAALPGSLDTALQILEVDVQSEFTTMLPYVGIMVALVVLAGRTALPSALAVPYERGRR